MGIDKNSSEISQKKHVSQMTTEELKAVLGEFEKEYNANNYGDYVNNEIVGRQKKGIIKWCVEKKICSYKQQNGITYWFVVLPGFYDWERKTEALKELKRRREYAIKLSTPTS